MKTETRFSYFALCVAIALLFWFLPVPEGLSPKAMRLLGIFIATIVGIITRALPMGAVALVGLTATIGANVLDFAAAFSGFSHPVVWLIVAAFFIAKGFTKTGLGSRIAYHFVHLVGKKTLGLGYGLVATELILSPAIPSNTARTGGVIFPILDSLSRSFGSDPQLGTARKVGSFLTMVAMQATLFTSTMFMTAMAPNPLMANVASEKGLTITWGSWALAALVPGVISLIFIPLLLYKLYPPAVKETPDAPHMAKEKLQEMGKMKIPEKVMLATFVGMLVLWIFGPQFHMDATTAAFIGLSALLIFGVLTWKEVLDHHGAWETLFWFASLVSMAANLGKMGVIGWMGQYIAGWIGGLSWPWAFLVLCLAYYYLHYLFASVLAHVVSLYPVFLSVAIAAGVPGMPAALSFAFLSSLFAGLTHYSSGPAAILYSPRYVPLKTWWGLNGVLSVLNFAVWIGLGSLWWKVIGLW
ncbi:MAG: anion permease [Parachlamydiales bacterium]